MMATPPRASRGSCSLGLLAEARRARENKGKIVNLSICYTLGKLVFCYRK